MVRLRLGEKMTDNDHTIRVYKLAMDIQIKMFDDHIVVESPGKLLGLVRADNIRFTHFSRKPKIAEFLKNYKLVKQFGEGVNRMCNELEQVGLKDPVYMLSLRNNPNHSITCSSQVFFSLPSVIHH